MLFFGSRCERLCMMQFALISLIPGLICSLQDCADPALDQYSQNVSKATSLKTSERSSCSFFDLHHHRSADLLSARIHGSTSTNIWKGSSITSLPISALILFYRAASLGHTHRCSSWIYWLTTEPNLISLALQIPFYFNKKTNTVISSSTLMRIW